MVNPTDRLDLNRYGAGDSNWSHSDTVETVDELAIERGAIADRPTSGNYDDELYLATDQQILYRWDETATDWIVEGVGSETDPLPKIWANEIDADSVNADELNSVEWQTENRPLGDALTSAGENGKVIVTAEETTSALDEHVQNGQTIIGWGGKIMDSSINVVDANGVSFLSVNVQIDRNGTALRFSGDNVLIDSCRVLNLDGGASARALSIGESNKFSITNCHCEGADDAIALQFAEAENGSIGDNIAVGGLSIDSDATNINVSNNTVV